MEVDPPESSQAPKPRVFVLPSPQRDTKYVVGLRRGPMPRTQNEALRSEILEVFRQPHGHLTYVRNLPQASSEPDLIQIRAYKIFWISKFIMNECFHIVHPFVCERTTTDLIFVRAPSHKQSSARLKTTAQKGPSSRRATLQGRIPPKTTSKPSASCGKDPQTSPRTSCSAATASAPWGLPTAPPRAAAPAHAPGGPAKQKPKVRPTCAPSLTSAPSRTTDAQTSRTDHADPPNQPEQLLHALAKNSESSRVVFHFHMS